MSRQTRLAVGGVCLLWTGCLQSLGGEAKSATLLSAARNAQYDAASSTFKNPVPPPEPPSFYGIAARFLFDPEDRTPPTAVPVRPVYAGDFDPPPTSGLRVTWLGHSAVLVEIDGVRLLTDPVFSLRCSPSQLVGPARYQPTPIDADRLPRIDAVVISHDHYDHLDVDTVLRMEAQRRVDRYVVPLGVGEHLVAWGVPRDRIDELDWSEEALIGGVRVVATAAQHFSGRTLAARNSTLWASYALVGPSHRVYFGGDTGWFPGFADIGAEHGPFDVTLMPIGAYDDAWPLSHVTPEQAVDAHLAVRGQVMLPIHWGTWDLAFHPWDEPASRLLTSAAAHDVVLTWPEAGQPVEVGSSLTSTSLWWRSPTSRSLPGG